MCISACTVHVHSKCDPVVFVMVSAPSAFSTPARVCVQYVCVYSVCVCACLRPFCTGGSGLCGDVIGAAGWGDMGLEFGRGPDSSSPRNVSDQEVCDSVCQSVSMEHPGLHCQVWKDEQ